MTKTETILGKKKAVAGFYDPFNTDCIKSINIFGKEKFAFTSNDVGKWEFTGTIEFINGNTKGSQRFNSESLDGVLVQMRAFFKEINSNNSNP